MNKRYKREYIKILTYFTEEDMWIQIFFSSKQSKYAKSEKHKCKGCTRPDGKMKVK